MILVLRVIAVVDPLPMFQHGVAGVLSAAGHMVDVPGDVLAWAARRRSALVLLTAAAEADWHLLSQLCRAGTVVVAMIDGSSGMLGAQAIRLGARSVIPRDTDAAVLRRTVEASLDGQSVMPATVAALLTGSTAPDVLQISATGATWLKQLALGTTVAQLAARSGYSERAMFRLLRSLYRDMGVESRVEAIMRAREWNWI
jgi:DNA-binding NarL/FixJ family response regulator